MVQAGYRLDLLLSITRLARSTYYYHVKQLQSPPKDLALQEEIQAIFTEHQGNYGYRRITLELRNRHYRVNHKKVQRLMKSLHLAAHIRSKRRYNAYMGEVGRKADNLIQRQFTSNQPMEKCYTDVTEFRLPHSSKKLYLSAVLDGYNSEIIGYSLSQTPDLRQLQATLERSFPKDDYPGTILHSDQGWQYQHLIYHQFLKRKKMKPSMSRRGNSPDNGMMESFFGILKSEMFYGRQKSYKTIDHLAQAIESYIHYYNHRRIKVKLKGLSPVQYRTKSFG